MRHPLGAVAPGVQPGNYDNGDIMDVWIVEAGADYELPFTTAVRSTEERAELLRTKWETTRSYDWVSVTKYTVDADEPDYSSIT